MPEKKEAHCRLILREESTFFPEEMELREQWQYYISSYMGVEPTEGVPRSKLQKVVLARNLPSDVDSDIEDGGGSGSSSLPKPVSYREGLVLRICLNSTKIVWEKGTSEYFVYPRREKSGNAGGKGDEDFEGKKTVTSPTGKNGYSSSVNTSDGGGSCDNKEAANASRPKRGAGPEATTVSSPQPATAIKNKAFGLMEEKLVRNNSWMKGLAHEEVERRKEAWKRFVEEGRVMLPGPRIAGAATGAATGAAAATASVSAADFSPGTGSGNGDSAVKAGLGPAAAAAVDGSSTVRDVSMKDA